MYWGALEPVGQATAVPTVLKMAESARMTLLSFEKPEDWEDRDFVARTKARLSDAGVRWLPLEYHRGRRATIRDARAGVRALKGLHRSDRITAVEGRTYVGGFIGGQFCARSGVPFLYHTEGAWLIEQLDQGALREGSLVFRLLSALERRTARRAKALVTLTEAGVADTKRRLLGGRKRTVTVIPTTSRLVEAAAPVGPSRVIAPGQPLRIVYAGSVTGRYLLEPMLDFVDALMLRRPGSIFRVFAHRDRDVVTASLARRDSSDRVEVTAVPHDRIGACLSEADVGLFFLQGGRSEPYVSPTKIPEYLAHGLVVVSTRASGDGAAVIEGSRSGVVIDDPTDPMQIERALDDLDTLLRDPDRGSRAQRAARDHYALDRAVSLQLEILTAMTSGTE
jgi:glycosyltransferase involved in cell wall biosynthesis